VAARGGARQEGAAAGKVFAAQGASGSIQRGGSGGGSVKFYDAALTALLEGPEGPVAKDLVKRALRCQAAAKRLCPVDTGRLRASIAWRIERDAIGLHAKVGSNVAYAAYVEFGTRRMAARPYLRPALMAAGRSATT
jgi:hypothetical protein